MNLQAIVDRVIAKAPSIKVADKAANLAMSLKKLPKQTSASVFPVSDNPGDNPYGTGMFGQKIKRSCGVLIATRNYGGARGGDAAEDIGEIITEVIHALAGWHHPDAEGPTLYSSGRMLAMDGTAALYLCQFTYTTAIRKETS